MSTPLGPGTAPKVCPVFNTDTVVLPKGRAVELDDGAAFAANKFLFDSVAYEVLPVQLPTGDNHIVGVVTEDILPGEAGEVVYCGLVQVIPAATTVVDTGATVITATGKFDDGATGIHSNASFGRWMEAGALDVLTWIYLQGRKDLPAT